MDKATLFIECKGFEIGLPIVMEGDKAKVDIPILENVITPGTYNMRMEMVLGGALYTPFKDKLDFKAPTKITVESVENKKEVVTETGPNISITATPKITVTEKAKTSEFSDLIKKLIIDSK